VYFKADLADKWLVEKKTFHEQDVKPDTELYYGKKFFVSDDHIDKDDPVTLHLLYIEALKAVIEGRIHVTRVDARDFAAFQMQIVYGDHNPAVHVPGYMEYVH
jgi:talin